MENKKIQTQENKEETPKLTPKQIYEHYWDIVFIILEIFTLIGLIFLLISIEPLRQDLMKRNPSYKFPQYKDLLKLIYILISFICCRTVIIKIFSKVGKLIMGKKYTDPSRPKDYALRNVLPEKIAIHFYKIIFYSISTILGYFLMKDLDYFPSSCLGKGEMKNMFLPGYPKAFYHKKPELLDFYYLLSFGYYLCDFLFLVISKDKSNEFILMILHHTCTIELILFSFLSNYTHVGSLVMFIQCVSDIPNHVTKIMLRTDCPYIFIVPVGLSFVLNYWFYRIYVHSQIIYTIYAYAQWKWSYITYFLFSFLIVLLVMQIYWSSYMLYKVVELFTGKKVYDNIEYNESIKREMKKIEDEKNKEKKKIE